MTVGVQWCLVHTLPNNEKRADINLRRQGFGTYLPRQVCRGLFD